MKTKHTQGEWEIEHGISYHFIRANEKPVAMIDSLPKTALPECEANANLIAAAPELLEALIGVQKWAESLDLSNPVLAKAWKSIQKATK